MSQPLPNSYHFKRRSRKKSRLSMREILDQPLPHLRMEFVHQLNKAKNPQKPEPFSADRLHYFLDQASKIADVDDEILNVDYAIAYGKALRKPDLSTPEKQFVWAAALSWLSVNPGHFVRWPGVDPKSPQLTQTNLWKQIIKAPYIRDELAQHAFSVFEGIRDDSTRLRWGAPNSWFYFHPEAKLINIDLSCSLLCGLEHARCLLYHEIGHGLLTLALPPKQEALRQEMLEIKKKQRGRKNKLTPEDYKRLRLLDFELSLRHQLFNVAEDNCVNTYADRMGQRLQQDIGFSLNHYISTIGGYGVRASGLDAQDRSNAQKKPSTNGKENEKKSEEWSQDAQRRLEAFDHLRDAVAMAFFCKNGLFPDTPEGWAELKLDPTKIGPWSKAPAPQTAPAANSNTPPSGASVSVPAPAWQTDPKSFDALVDMCVGLQKSMASLQPESKDRLYGPLYFDNLKRRMSQERNEIVEKIWDLHVEDLIRPLLQELDEKLEEQMKEQQEKQNGDQGQDQDGEGNEGEGDDGDQDGEGQESDGQGKGKKGQKGQKQKKKKKPQKDQGDDQDGGEQDEDGQDGAGENGDEQDGKQGNQKGKPQRGQKGEKTVDVDDVGDMPDVDVPGEDADKKKEKDAQNKGDKGDDGEDGEGEDEGESVKDLMDKAKKGQQGDDGDDGDEDGEGDPSEDSQSRKPGKGEGHKFDELTKADLAEYDKVVAELAGPIAETARMLRKIREHQVRTKPKLSRDLDLLPEDGDAARLNPDAHQSLITKQLTHQNITEKDFQRFRTDKQNPVWADIELGILIDGSGSMTGDRLKRAMQAAIILYEAGKRVGIDCYIGMWGNADPPIVARPGDDHATIGKAIATIMQGLRSGTELTPAIHKITKEMAYNRERRAKNPLVGLTHLMVISDGDIQDAPKAMEAIDTLFKASQHVTLDIALVAHDSGAIIGKLKDLKTRHKYQEISVTDDFKPASITSGMIGALLQRIRISGSFTAVLRSVKRQTFKRAYHQMRPKP